MEKLKDIEKKQARTIFFDDPEHDSGCKKEITPEKNKDRGLLFGGVILGILFGFMGNIVVNSLFKILSGENVGYFTVLFWFGFIASMIPLVYMIYLFRII